MTSDSGEDSASRVYGEIIDAHQELEKIYKDHASLHLFCPKVDDWDEEDYDKPDQPGDTIDAAVKKTRIEEASRRLHLASWTSLILGINKEQASTWLSEWVDQADSFLTKCDSCIRSWHMNRKALRNRILKEFNEATADAMEERLFQFDKARIDRGLQKALDMLDTHGSMNVGKLAALDDTAVLGLHEALCSVEYLSLPANRPLFNQVFRRLQEKKPLRVGDAVVPAMTIFLFHDDEYRPRFAKAAWQRLPLGILTPDLFDWAVNDHLAAAIDKVNKPNTPFSQIEIFWKGFLVLLDCLSEDLILHSLRGMQIQPDVYSLATQHLVCNSEQILALLIRAICALLEKSPKAFWDALNTLPPNQLPMVIMQSPAFGGFLTRSFEEGMMVQDGTNLTPLLVAFVRAFMKSLPTNRRDGVCQSLISTFVSDPVAKGNAEGQATRVAACLTALQLTLDGFLDAHYRFSSDCLIYINPSIRLTIKQQAMVIRAIRMHQGDPYNIGLSQTAMLVARAALALDTRATREEWRRIEADSPLHQYDERDSPQLWAMFLEALVPGRVDLAKYMLMATLSLRGVQSFLPKKGQLDVTDEAQKRFNKDFQQTAEAIARVLERLSESPPAELKALCSDRQTRSVDAIVATLIHGEEPIRDAGVLLINAITGEDRRSDAIVKMVQDFPHAFLEAFSDSVDRVIVDRETRESYDPWAPMPNILRCSRDILGGLCDTTVGLLRSRTSSPAEQQAVRHWWTQQWQYVDYSFRRARFWSESWVKKKDMENYCRDVMELAESLLAQDGLIASALSKTGDRETTERAMREVLDAPRRHSLGFKDMIQLKDTWLLDVIVKILVKLLRRLKEYDMSLPDVAIGFIRDACTRHPDLPGRCVLNTNMDGTQRAELMKALGDSYDDGVEVTPVAPAAAKPKKQSTIDAWSRAGSTSSVSSVSSRTTHAPRPARDLASELTPGLKRHQGLLDKMKAKADPSAVLANRMALRESRERSKAEMLKSKQEAIAKAQALRAKTADPPKKSDIMVDSSSEDSTDGSTDEEDAALRRRIQKRQDDAVSEQQRMQALHRRLPVKKAKLQRSAKDLKARLIPQMERLHQAILEWDIFHEGNDPPNGYRCEAVAKEYAHPKAYREAFFPLLVNEAWRSFVTAKEETTARPFGVKVVTRMSVDNFLEVGTTMPMAAGKDRQLGEGDIILLSKSADPLASRSEPHCLARIWKTTHKKEALEVAYRLSVKGNQILPVLLPGAEFHAIKITNMTTIEREFAALESLQYYDVMQEVLAAEPSPKLRFRDEHIGTYEKNYQLNRAQAVAVLNAEENDGFVLVQGPPGTGKTKTIVAMAGALLTGTLKSDKAAVPIVRPGGAPPPGQGTAKKLLICAPSNAAVDELVLRLKAGVKETSGAWRAIKILRLGRSDAINAAVKDVTLDELVKAELEREAGKGLEGGGGGVSDREKLHQRAGEIKAQLAELRPALEAARCGENREAENKLQREMDQLRTEQRQIGARIDRDKDSGKTYAREAEIKRRSIQQKILNEAHVLCATLSGSGHEMFRNLNVEFETVIIDEAAQCVELSALIPLKYGCSKCILVGDPKQLPPTVLSQSAAKYGYDQSLFVRMQQNHPDDVHLLDTQYRMHPEISRFPSEQFYEARLLDGGDMATLRRQPWHASPLLGPYRFFDVAGVQEKGDKGRSLVNVNELRVAMQLYERFRRDYSSLDLRRKIGIITPYKAQLFALRQRFTDRYGAAVTDEIEFNTTDAFQGRECEVIIFSCVRASASGGIGFMTDIRRMNVGLTRAKSSLWILGDSRALRQGPFWDLLIKDAKSRDRYTSGNILGLLGVPDKQAAPASGRQGGSAATPFSALSLQPAPEPARPKTGEEAGEARRAPPRRPAPTPTPPTTHTAADRVGPRSAQGHDDSSKGGAKEEEAAAHSSPSTAEAGPAKKRPLEAGSGLAPPAKRFQSAKAHRGAIPTGPRAMQAQAAASPRQAKPAARPTDPSAMEVLGIDAEANQRANAPPNGPPGHTAPSRRKKKKKAVDPFIPRNSNKKH